MAEKFSDCPEALANTNIIAERCNVELNLDICFCRSLLFEALMRSYLHHGAKKV